MTSKGVTTTSVAVVILFTLVSAMGAWQARNFEIDASAETLLTKGNRHYLVSQQAAQRYDPDEFILIAYQPNDESIYAKSTLQRVDEIAAKVKNIERVKDVLSLVNVPIFTGLNELSTDIDPSKLTWKQQQYSEARLRKSLANHPLYEGLLVNEDHNAMALQVVFNEHPELARVESEIASISSHQLERELTDKEQESLAALTKKREAITKELQETRIEEIEEIRSILQSYQPHGEFYLGGGNLLAYQLIKIIKSDLVLFGLLITIIISLVLYYLFRQMRWVLIPLLCCLISVVNTIGLLAVLGLKVTVISANVIALQIILTLAIVIHIIVQYQELLQQRETEQEKDAGKKVAREQHGLTEQQALVMSTIKRKVKPCIYAGLTTAIGFGSLIFSGVQPVISFGWMMVVAMLVTLVVSLTLFPALLISFLKVRNQVQQHKFVEKIMRGCASLVKNRPGAIVLASIIIAGVGVAGCFRLTAENSFIDYFSDSTDVYRELSFIDQHFGGSTPFDILYTVPKEQREKELVLTAKAVQTVTAIQKKLAQHEAIGTITSIADFTLVAKTVAGKPLTEYELTALYRALDDDLKDELFGSYFSRQHDQIRISTRVQDSTEGLDRSQLIADIHNDMEQLGIAKENYQFTNLFVLYQDILSRLVKSQFVTLGIVYLAMALVLWVIFRSLKVALIALVPNVITTAGIMGAMGLLNIPLDLMTLTIAAVAMGISVDDTIHYVHRYLDENAQGPVDAVKATNLSVGYAVLYTTLVIILGFASLMFSDFVPSILFGLLTSLAMGLALLTDITILPVLLRRFISQPKNRKNQSDVHVEGEFQEGT